ncbi:hypothetical protein L596_012431 [Steinernema carpocapsae]|uniref:Uncharacterized protein n=1 Tax=Steinernema carpocapsae TaxID=34508 RepID=A0A4U5NXE3_STECR|nr:hypothetical protein L596_012431 [Steinernema carpocapsae]
MDLRLLLFAVFLDFGLQIPAASTSWDLPSPSTLAGNWSKERSKTLPSTCSRYTRTKMLQTRLKSMLKTSRIS